MNKKTQINDLGLGFCLVSRSRWCRWLRLCLVSWRQGHWHRYCWGYGPVRECKPCWCISYWIIAGVRSKPVKILQDVWIIVQVRTVTCVPIVMTPMVMVISIVIESKLESVTMKMMVVVVMNSWSMNRCNWMHMMRSVMVMIVPIVRWGRSSRWRNWLSCWRNWFFGRLRRLSKRNTTNQQASKYCQNVFHNELLN